MTYNMYTTHNKSDRYNFICHNLSILVDIIICSKYPLLKVAKCIVYWVNGQNNDTYYTDGKIHRSVDVNELPTLLHLFSMAYLSLVLPSVCACGCVCVDTII